MTNPDGSPDNNYHLLKISLLKTKQKTKPQTNKTKTALTIILSPS